jgi:hypothetical protein
MPPQQSAPFEQTSPVWMHHPGVSAHVPLLQNLEQHSSLPPHVLPAVLHDVFIGWHAPFAHVPPQHEAFVVHGWLSETHVEPHVPLLQLSEQQSVPVAHAPPEAIQCPTVEPHVPFASQVPEQHWFPP